MKKMKHLFFTVFTVTLFLTSCSSDDDNIIEQVPEGDYAAGSFVLNEGNGDPATASISFIAENGTVTNDIFRKVNPAAAEIGTYLQNMFFDDTHAFIVSGSANSVTVVDRYSFEYVATVSGDFENPRYGTVVGDKAYVTSYADYSTGDDDFMTVIDLNDYSTTRIVLGNWSEKVLSKDDKIYIANGYYGDGNSISVFNTNSNTIEKVIDLGDGNSPNSFEIDDDKLYVLTSNYEGPGQLFTIDMTSASIDQTITLSEAIANPRNLKIEDDSIYYTSGASVFSMQKGASELSTTPLITYESDSEYGVMNGFDVEDEAIYISDGGDFASDSNAYRYSLDGNLQQTYTVGVGPNGFYSNN
jgi:hypothetical protein